ncbi:F-box/kelch-repeat protein At3g06240-like [Rosa rugosa]|uniref:F-box/kelch-repeat protein At3g06240-like n=1 Tax=Rosa rugosa TaxID=74645 RepID=UPI002B4078EF|nr:F-box/kelch-repeat protein At3g06240-like [Rosa rugosa]
MANCSKLHVPDEIVEEILSRLPPKSLMRFKCVCTLWCNLIKSHSFVAKHLSNSLRASSSVSILFKHTVEKMVDHEISNEEGSILLSLLNRCNDDVDDLFSIVVENLNVPPPLNQIGFSSYLGIAGHCDGIICLKLFYGNVVLCNPAIKEFKLLPKSVLILPNRDSLYLAFELENYTELLGFGYDPKGKDYKVVRLLVYSLFSYWFKTEVYTMGSNSWREIKTKYTNDYHFKDCWDKQQLFYEGKYYWQVCGFDRGHNLVHKFILSFDMGDELFYEISLPWQDTETYGGTQGRLAVWKGSIALVSFEHEIVGPQSFDIWVMMNNSCGVKSPWTKYLTIGPMEGIDIPVVYPLVFWKNDELVMVAVDGRVVSYNLGTQTFKYLPIHFVEDFPDTQAVVYMSSIVSVEGGDKLEGIDNTAFYGIMTLPNGRLTSAGPHKYSYY